MYRPRALPALLAMVVLDVAIGSLLLFLLAGCNGGQTVTSGGVPVTNQAIITARKTVEVAELSATALANGITAAYEAGKLSRSVPEQFQSSIAPKIKAALATAKIALQTWNDAPGKEKEVIAFDALAALARELQALQGWYTNHVAIGVAR